MPNELKYYRDLACDLVEEYRDLREMQAGLDDLAHLKYSLPAELEALEWVRKFIDSSPYEAYRAATRTLASLLPRIKVDTVTVSIEDDDTQAVRDKANQWEKVLLWQYKLATLRQGMLQSDIIASALRQDEICAQVVYLPEQIASIKAMGGNAKRYESAQRYGDYTIILRDPKTVYARYSDYMLEAVLHVQVMAPQAMVDFWGEKASEIKRRIETNDECPDTYIQFHYTDYESIVTWAVPGLDVEEATTLMLDEASAVKDVVELERRENPHAFLNGWVCVRGGTQLESDPRYQRQPMLWPVYITQQWVNANIMGTLMMSEPIAKAAGPTGIIEGPNPNSVEIEYGTPAQPIIVPPGHKYTQISKDQLDPALNEGYNQLKTSMQNATVARILTTADPVPNESFSGANLRYKTASDSLMPWRKLSERAETEIFRTMLLWAKFTKHDLAGFSTQRNDKGKAYKIKHSDIDPNRLYLETELIADVPIDRQAQVNTAVQMSREMRFPAARILEEMGVTDPEQAMKEYYKEQFKWAAIQGKLKLIAAQSSNEIDQLAAQKAQEMVKQQMDQMAQQQQAQAQQGQAGGQQGLQGLPPEMAGAMGGQAPDMMGGGGMPGVGGPGFAPPMGGQPPSMANPAGGVREQQTGQAGGVPLQ